MRVLCLLFLVVFAGAVTLFAWQNQSDVTLTFFNWTFSENIALVIGAAFVLGMFSGWTIVGLLRRSVKTVMHGAERRE
jgi:uncharacterized membrane protein YciS (DUF1049 family)